MSEQEVVQKEPKLRNYIELNSIIDVNEWSEKGYKLHSVDPWISEYGHTNGWHYVMYLDKGNYDNVTNLADVSPQDVDRYLANGWEIASTSISTKFVRMIKRDVK